MIINTKPEKDIIRPKMVEILNGIVEKLVNIFNHKLISFLNVYPDLPWDLSNVLFNYS